MIPSVLVVDDVASTRESLVELLEASGEFEAVGEAENGVEAVDRAREARPDLAIMDIRMPRMDGIEATRQIRETSPNTLIIAHSAYQDISLVKDMIAAGAKGYVLKGSGGDRLLEALHAALAGHAVLPPEVTRALLDDLRQLYEGQVKRSEQLTGMVEHYQDVATRDHLTSLLNHRAFHEHLEEAVASAERARRVVSVAVLDIDDFKLVNDLFGHVSGDRLLQDMAKLLRQSLGSDARLYRIGGDELAAILPDTSKDRARELLEAARRSVAAMKFGQHRQQTISAGIAMYPADGPDKDAVLSMADAAMYEAKSRGKDGVVVAGEHRTPAARRDENADEAVQRMVIAVTAALGARNENTLRHCEEVGALAAAIAEECGMTPAEIETVRLGGLLHDVGKIGVADGVLLKPGGLDEQERDQMRRHPEVGKLILGRTLPRAVLDCVAHHHEQPDGKGYPFGLKGDEIPFIAGIVRVADVFESMTRDQPWRRALPPAAALAQIAAGADTLFNAEACDALKRLLAREQRSMAA